MILETIHLKDHFKMLEHDIILESYCPSNYDEFSKTKRRECVIVLPGGGYHFLSEREAEPVALRFAGSNIASFILRYTIAPKIKYPYPLVEVLAAVAYIRKNADKYHVNPDKIAVCGFSAGGHLAASASAYYFDKELLDFLKLEEKDTKINGCILGYPVISSTYGEMGTIQNSTGGDPYLLDKLSIEKHVTEKFPRTFIWHTTFDSVVPVKNALYLADALSDKKVFYEMHIFPMLDHGQSLADDSVYNDNFPKNDLEWMKPNSKWIDMAIYFVKKYVM